MLILSPAYLDVSDIKDTLGAILQYQIFYRELINETNLHGSFTAHVKKMQSYNT